MRILVEAVEQSADTDWDLLDEDDDGYDGEPREGEVSDALVDAGFGHCGTYVITTTIWNDCVPNNKPNSKLEGRDVQIPSPSTERDLQNVLQGATM